MEKIKKIFLDNNINIYDYESVIPNNILESAGEYISSSLEPVLFKQYSKQAILEIVTETSENR